MFNKKKITSAILAAVMSVGVVSIALAHPADQVSDEHATPNRFMVEEPFPYSAPLTLEERTLANEISIFLYPETAMVNNGHVELPPMFSPVPQDFQYSPDKNALLIVESVDCHGIVNKSDKDVCKNIMKQKEKYVKELYEAYSNMTPAQKAFARRMARIHELNREFSRGIFHTSK